MALDGPMGGLAFEAHVGQALVAVLAPGAIVIMDDPAAPPRPMRPPLRGLRNTFPGAG